MEIQFSNIFCGKTILFHRTVFVTLLKTMWPPLVSLSGLCVLLHRHRWAVAKLCSALCDPVVSSVPGFPVLHCLRSNSCPLSWWCQLMIHPLPPLLLLPSVTSCMRVFFQRVGSLHQVAHWSMCSSLHEYKVLITAAWSRSYSMLVQCGQVNFFGGGVASSSFFVFLNKF